MQDSTQSDKDRFLYPRSTYHGDFSPELLVFNANLQEFAQHISYISALQTGGKITSYEAYQRIKQHYKQLKRSKKNLGLNLG